MTDAHHWLCITGAGYDKNQSNVNYGTCGSPLKVTSPGSGCDATFSKCATNNTAKNAQDVGPCGCTYASNATQVCGVERGNDEWVNVVAKFKVYLQATRDCHVARSFYDECDSPQLYND
jgi:hypothetical protein